MIEFKLLGYCIIQPICLVFPLSILCSLFLFIALFSCLVLRVPSPTSAVDSRFEHPSGQTKDYIYITSKVTFQRPFGYFEEIRRFRMCVIRYI